MQLTAIRQITGHKSDTVAKKYIDHSKNMKQGGADALSLEGLQKDEDGQVLRKRKSSNDYLQSTKLPGGSNDGGKMNVSFHNCTTVNYNSHTKNSVCNFQNIADSVCENAEKNE